MKYRDPVIDWINHDRLERLRKCIDYLHDEAIITRKEKEALHDKVSDDFYEVFLDKKTK
jgi:hypothetical protein